MKPSNEKEVREPLQLDRGEGCWPRPRRPSPYGRPALQAVWRRPLPGHATAQPPAGVRRLVREPRGAACPPAPHRCQSGAGEVRGTVSRVARAGGFVPASAVVTPLDLADTYCAFCLPRRRAWLAALRRRSDCVCTGCLRDPDADRGEVGRRAAERVAALEDEVAIW